MDPVPARAGTRSRGQRPRRPRSRRSAPRARVEPSIRSPHTWNRSPLPPRIVRLSPPRRAMTEEYPRALTARGVRDVGTSGRCTQMVAEQGALGPGGRPGGRRHHRRRHGRGGGEPRRDGTSGDRGVALVNLGGADRAVAGFRLDSGRYLLVGHTKDGDDGRIALARLLPGGGLDSSFGNAGRLVVAGIAIGEAEAAALAPDGKIPCSRSAAPTTATRSCGSARTGVRTPRSVLMAWCAPPATRSCPRPSRCSRTVASCSPPTGSSATPRRAKPRPELRAGRHRQRRQLRWHRPTPRGRQGPHVRRRGSAAGGSSLGLGRETGPRLRACHRRQRLRLGLAPL